MTKSTEPTETEPMTEQALYEAMQTAIKTENLNEIIRLRAIQSNLPFVQIGAYLREAQQRLSQWQQATEKAETRRKRLSDELTRQEGLYAARVNYQGLRAQGDSRIELRSLLNAHCQRIQAVESAQKQAGIHLEFLEKTVRKYAGDIGYQALLEWPRLHFKLDDEKQKAEEMLRDLTADETDTLPAFLQGEEVTA